MDLSWHRCTFQFLLRICENAWKPLELGTPRRLWRVGEYRWRWPYREWPTLPPQQQQQQVNSERRSIKPPLLGHAYHNNNKQNILRMTTHSLECIACQRRYILFSVRCLSLVVNWFHLQRARPLHERNKWMQCVANEHRLPDVLQLQHIMYFLLFFFFRRWTTELATDSVTFNVASAGGAVARMHVSRTLNTFFVSCNIHFFPLRKISFQLAHSGFLVCPHGALEYASRGKCKCNLSRFYFCYLSNQTGLPCVCGGRGWVVVR